MRVIKKEHIITTVFNRDFVVDNEDDLETINIVLKNLKDHRIEFSAIINKPTSLIGEYIRFVHDKVRILKIHEDDTVDFFIMKKGTNMKENKVPFAWIEEINILTKKHQVIDVVNDITRFDLLDL